MAANDATRSLAIKNGVLFACCFRDAECASLPRPHAGLKALLPKSRIGQKKYLCHNQNAQQSMHHMRHTGPKILNPATGRYVLRHGKIGQSILNRQQMAGCRGDQIVNPATGRCVSKNGKIGRQLLCMLAPMPAARRRRARRPAARRPAARRPAARRRRPSANMADARSQLASGIAGRIAAWKLPSQRRVAPPQTFALPPQPVAEAFDYDPRMGPGVPLD
jgi:hypothetical protein